MGQINRLDERVFKQHVAGLIDPPTTPGDLHTQTAVTLVIDQVEFMRAPHNRLD